VKCPICKKPVEIGDPYMPFCSNRCRIVDLGNWASEKYVISSEIDPESEEEQEPESRGDDEP
jgi:endogenous inhibitor of DNA gyrase (YacG/DUF329 family)